MDRTEGITLMETNIIGAPTLFNERSRYCCVGNNRQDMDTSEFESTIALFGLSME
jgi:hypothetical protein